MPKFIDLSNRRFSKLTVISRAENKGKAIYWNCKCDCGNDCVVRGWHLTSKRTTSCPVCGRKRQADSISIHGDYKSKLYAIWQSMKQRCINPNAQEYHNYGGRGIAVCEEWKDYPSFKKWALDNGYIEGLSIERIDVNGNYEPDNCKWIELSQQGFNKRSNNMITFDGVTKCATEMAKDYGLKPNVLIGRLNRGWTIERALLEPLHLEKIHN